MRKADLHIHTEASDDSILKPEGIFQSARNAGLSALAFTDHDGVANIECGFGLSGEYDILFLPGIELTGSWHNQLAHVLGYFPESIPAELKEFIDANIHAATRRTAEVMISRMSEHGIEVTLADYHAEIEAGGMEGSPLLRLLVKKGVVRHADEYQQRFGTDEYEVADCFYPTVTRIVAFLKETGCCAVLAHPGSRGQYGLCDMREPDICCLADVGLDGLEVYHPLHSNDDVAEYARIADRLDLLKSGGSDSHGHQGAHERAVGTSFCNWDEVEKRIIG